MTDNNNLFSNSPISSSFSSISSSNKDNQMTSNASLTTTSVSSTIRPHTTLDSFKGTRTVTFEQSESGKSHRLVAYAMINGEPKPWNSAEDLSLVSYTQADSGLNAIANFMAGMINGTPDIIFTAPSVKLNYKYGTGAMGFVWGTYSNDLVIDDKMIVFDPKSMPTHQNAVKRMFLTMGSLSLGHQEYTPESDLNDLGAYFYALAARALLDNSNVSISVGPNLLEKAKGVVALFHAENVSRANDDRKFALRDAGDFMKSANNIQATEQRVAQVTGVAPKVTVSDLVAPAWGAGKEGVFDLTGWNTNVRVPVVKVENGVVSKRPAQKIAANSNLAIKSFISALRSQGWAVDLDTIAKGNF